MVDAALPPPFLDAEQAAFVCGPVSINAASFRHGGLPNLARVTGCRLSADRHVVTLLLAATPAAGLLEDLRCNGMIAVVFSLPASHHTIQLKGGDARIVPIEPGDVELAARYVDAFVGGLENRPVTEERMAGYRAAMAEAGLATIAFPGRPSRAFGRDTARALHADHPDIEAALCFSDLVALGMLAGFAQEGVRVGAGFRLVGFDDIEECALTWPQLSSVRCDVARFGRESAEAMLAWLEAGDRPPATRLAPVELIVRGTDSIRNAESRKLMWLGHRIAGPSCGRRSKPSRWMCHSWRAIGRATVRRRVCARPPPSAFIPTPHGGTLLRAGDAGRAWG